MTIIRLRYVYYYAYFIKYLLINQWLRYVHYFIKYLLINSVTIIVGVWVTNHHLRVYLVSVIVGPPLWDMGKSLSDTHETRYMPQGRNVHPLIRTYNEHRYCMCYLLKPGHRGCSSRQSSLCIFLGGSLWALGVRVRPRRFLTLNYNILF